MVATLSRVTPSRIATTLRFAQKFGNSLFWHCAPSQNWSAVQVMPQPPQLVSAVVLRHALLQHAWLAPHERPHAPQLFGSDPRLSQRPPQQVWFAPQGDVVLHAPTQVPFWQMLPAAH